MAEILALVLASPLIGFGLRLGWQFGSEIWARARTAYWVRTGR